MQLTHKGFMKVPYGFSAPEKYFVNFFQQLKTLNEIFRTDKI